MGMYKQIAGGMLLPLDRPMYSGVIQLRLYIYDPVAMKNRHRFIVFSGEVQVKLFLRQCAEVNYVRNETRKALALASERESEIERQSALVKQETARANQEAARANALARELAELRAQLAELSVLRHKKVKQDDGDV